MYVKEFYLYVEAILPFFFKRKVNKTYQIYVWERERFIYASNLAMYPKNSWIIWKREKKKTTTIINSKIKRELLD